MVVSWYALRRRPIATRLVIAFLFSLSTFSFLFFVSVSWVIRDGVDRDRIETHGPETVSRFMGVLWANVYLSMIIIATGCFIYTISVLRQRKLAK